MAISSTKRVRLDIDKMALANLGDMFTAFYNLRPTSGASRVDKFQALETQLNDAEALGEFFGQSNRLSLPAIVYRRNTVSQAAEYLNAYVSQRDGVVIGYTKDREHAITLHSVKVVFSLGVTLLTDNWDVLDHFIKTAMMYGKQELTLGHVELTDPKYKFTTRGKFADSFDYPELGAQSDAFQGYSLTTNLDLSTFVADLQYVPTLGSISIQPVVNSVYSDFDTVSALVADTNTVDNPGPVANYIDPELKFTVDLRPSLADPAQRN
jgi:hypothetical protein